MKDKMSASEFREYMNKGYINQDKKGKLKIDCEFERKFMPEKSKKKNKFNAKKTEYNGDIYDSKKEADYARKLDLQGVKYDKQVRFDIIINGKKCGFYKLDFRVYYPDRTEHIDIKGLRYGSAYQIFRLKKKIIEALYNIQIIEL